MFAFIHVFQIPTQTKPGTQTHLKKYHVNSMQPNK
jgi:hypothetical protein